MHGSRIAQEMTGTMPVEQATPVAAADNMQMSENLSAVAKPGTVWIWALLFVLYIAWNWLQSRTSIMREIKPANVQANVHNLLIITIGVIIGVNGLQVLLNKLAKMKVPIVSKTAATFLPLVYL